MKKEKNLQMRKCIFSFTPIDLSILLPYYKVIDETKPRGRQFHVVSRQK